MHCPEIRRWTELGDVSAVLQFIGENPEYVRPVRNITVARGRPFCDAPPLDSLEALPCSGCFRELIVPPRDRFFIHIDVRHIRHAVLAALFEQEYGQSTFAQVLREGHDPDEYVAARLVTLNGRPSKLSSFPMLHIASVLNRVVPLGANASMVRDALRVEHNLDVDLREAERLRATFVGELFPEIGRYLKDDGWQLLAQALDVPVDECRRILGLGGACDLIGRIRQITRGETVDEQNEPYPADMLDHVWGKLQMLNRNSALTDALQARRAAPDLKSRLFDRKVVTLTGRIRSRIPDDEAKSAPIRENLLDVIQLAVIALAEERYEILFYTEDEILLGLYDDFSDLQDPDTPWTVPRAKEIVERVIASALGGIPVRCGVTVARHWGEVGKYTDVSSMLADGKACRGT